MRKLFISVLASVAALGLAACGPVTPAPTTPAPQPTFQCTPEAGGTPAPCSQREYDDMLARDALYAEAEGVARRLYAELEKMYRSGGYVALPPELESLTAGSTRDGVLTLARTVHERQSKSVGGEFKLVWVHRNVGAVKEGSEISVVTCFDARSTRTVQPGAADTRGEITSDQLFLRRVDGALKVWADMPAEKQECA